MRPAPLPEVAGPQAAVTVGYVAAVAPSLAVVLVSDMLHDDATVQFLLRQSLLARAEEEEARVQEDLKGLEEAVVTKMQRLEAEVMQYAGRDRSQLSNLEKAAVTLVAHPDAFRRRRERRRKRKKQRKEKLPRAPHPRCRRLCHQQRQDPALRIPVVTQRQVPTVHLFMLPVQFLDKVLDMPVVVQRQVLRSMVQKTVESPQLHFIDGRRHSLSFRRSSSSRSSLFSGSLRFRSCRSFFAGRCPCCAGRADSQVPPWRRPRFFFCRQAQMLGIMAGMAQKNSCAATQLCLAGFDGDDAARAVSADQTCTEASGIFYYVFYVKVNLDPEVDSRRGNLDIHSTSSTWQFIRQLQRLLEEFLVCST